MKTRRPLLVRPEPPRQENADVRSPGDFSDPESQRVVRALADALVGPAIRQKARADFAEWLSAGAALS